MNSQQAVDRLMEIEDSGLTESLTLGGENVWPLLRRELWFHYVKDQQPGKPIRFWNPMYGRRAAIRRCFRDTVAFRQHRKTLDSLRPPSETFSDSPRLLFVSYNKVAGVPSKGTVFDTRIDPYIEWFRSRGWQTNKTVIDPPKKESTYENWAYPPDSMLPNELVKKASAVNRIVSLSKKTRALDRALRAISQSFPEIDGYRCTHLTKGIGYRSYFRKLFVSTKPRAVFVTYFYNPICMALIASAKSLGIPVIDLQHGKQGIQGMYYGWSRVPTFGYQTLPDHFWMWGRPAADSLASKMPRPLHHKPFVGGNLWIKTFRETPQRFEPEALNTFRTHCEKFKQIILVSLQHNATVPSAVLDAMRARRPDRLWLIRCHPIVNAHSRDEIASQLQQAGAGEAFDIHSASDLPLFSLLALSTHHVTEWSSVCYEAEAFDVPTTFVHAEAQLHFGEMIRKNYFQYAADGNALLESIEKPKIPPGKSGFFESPENCEGQFPNFLETHPTSQRNLPQ